jgi:3-carboxy-cis,cis-muconate cycloisomerase
MLLAENVATVVSEKLGRLDAHDLVEAACRRALEGGRHLREELAQDAQIRAVLSEAEIDAALDPAGYLGSAGAFVDRALALYRGEAS